VITAYTELIIDGWDALPDIRRGDLLSRAYRQPPASCSTSNTTEPHDLHTATRGYAERLSDWDGGRMMANRPVALGLSLVREATRDAHARLENALDLAAWDTSYHRRWTSLLLGLHEPLEAALDLWWQDAHGMPMVWESRRRSALLLADLRALGLSEADLHALPRCRVPRPDGLPEILGQLYVLDGSTLGGAVIASAAMAAGVPANACRALTHSGSNIRYWRQTRTSIEGLGAVDSAAAARAAGELFDVFESWLGPATGEQLPVYA